MSCDFENNPVTIDELEIQLKDAKKGIAKVDKKYVNYKENGHLFEYDIDFGRFLDDINFILEAIKKEN